MDFSNEYYVRLYVRDTTTWKRLGWDGQCVFMQVLRKVDRAGVLDIEDMDPWEAVALHTGAPEEAARNGVATCLRLGVLEHNGRQLVAPRYREANEARKSDAQRQRELRAAKAAERGGQSQEVGVTARDGDKPNVTPPSQNVTGSHELSQAVTGSHTASHSVTLTSSSSRSSAGASSARAPESFAEDPDEQEARLEPYAGLDGVEMARAWAAASTQVFGVDPKARAAFAAMASTLERSEGEHARLACWVYAHWLFRAPDGPVLSGRMKRVRPWSVQAGVAEDLPAARAWFNALSEHEQERVLPPRSLPALEATA